jgi:hypothetical protein
MCSIVELASSMSSKRSSSIGARGCPREFSGVLHDFKLIARKLLEADFIAARDALLQRLRDGGYSP